MVVFIVIRTIQWLFCDLPNALRRFALGVLCYTLMACTSIGIHDESAYLNRDFGPEEPLRICVLLDSEDVSAAEGAALMRPVIEEFAQYKIEISVPWYKAWQRPGFANQKIVEGLANRRLQPPCDRLLALVGRNFGDFMFGLAGVEVLGSVDTVTHTRGYVVSEVASFNQLITPPESAAIHETYHLLGCEHDLAMAACYGRIQKLKAAARKNRESGNDFFPTYTRLNQIITRREDVDLLEAAAVRVHRAKKK